MLTKDEARELAGGSLEHKGPWFKFRLCMLYARIDKKIENAAESGKAFLVCDMDDIPAMKYFPVMRIYYENLGFFVAYKTGNNRSKFIVSWDYDRFSESDKREIWFGYDYRTFDDPDVRYLGEVHKKKKNRSTVTDEAVSVVRDHLVSMARGCHRNTYGYEWALENGGKVTLMVKIEEGSKDDK